MRPFRLYREDDISGVSGTGVVAEGVEFSDGRCCLRWLGPISSIGIYRNISELIYVHGHDGASRIVYLENANGSSLKG